MYSFIISNASKLFYGAIIAIAAYACWNVYDNYTDMQETIEIQSETISNQKNQLSILATVADENARLYFKAKADSEYLSNQIYILNKDIAEIQSKQKSEEISIHKEIDNAPEEIKKCLRSDLPDSVVSSLRKPK